MKSKTVLFGFAVMFVLLAFTVVPVAAAAAKPAPVNIPYLVAKDANGVETPSEGIGTFTYKGANIILTAKYLDPSTEYALISYAEPPAVYSNVLKVGVSDANGGMKMEMRGGDVFGKLIYNTYTSGEYAGKTGVRIWLVPTSDLQIGIDGKAKFIGWNPLTYLYESDLITQVVKA